MDSPMDWTGLSTFLAAIVSAISTVWVLVRQSRAEAKLEQVHVLVNSQADLMKKTLEAKGAAEADVALAKGKEIGQAEERANPMVRAPIQEPNAAKE